MRVVVEQAVTMSHCFYTRFSTVAINIVQWYPLLGWCDRINNRVCTNRRHSCCWYSPSFNIASNASRICLKVGRSWTERKIMERSIDWNAPWGLWPSIAPLDWQMEEDKKWELWVAAGTTKMNRKKKCTREGLKYNTYTVISGVRVLV